MMTDMAYSWYERQVAGSMTLAASRCAAPTFSDGADMYFDAVHLILSVPYPLTFAGITLVAGFLVKRLAFRQRPVGQFLCQFVTIVAFTALLAAAGVIPFTPTPVMAVTATYVLISFFKIVWWLAVAWLMAGFIHAALVFKRKPVETQFLQDVCAGFIYVVAVFAIIANVFDTAISGLLAASGIIAIVLGLALQSTLGDVFSGVVLNLSKPYQSGDWVILDGGLEGRIVKTNWRATEIRTLHNDLAIVPNSILAKSRIVNLSDPDSAHGMTIVVRLDPAIAPSTGVAMLETAMLSCTKILRVPAATVTVQSLDAAALQCGLEFFVLAIEAGPDAQNEVFDRVFRHCIAAGIRLAPPAGSPLSLPPRGAVRDLADVPRLMLDRLPLFATLAEDERLALAPKMTRRIYRAGDVLLEQGQVSPALYILHSGVLVVLQHQAKNDAEVFRLAPGDCFGQASLLTGASNAFKVTALTKVIAYEILKDDLAPLLKKRPAIAAELSQILAKRDAAGKMRLHELSEGDEGSDNLAGRLADRIKSLFGLT
jgi:small-conductance mechanosensitive channel/CRP-like cAMP-binding protein